MTKNTSTQTWHDKDAMEQAQKHANAVGSEWYRKTYETVEEAKAA